MGWPGMEPDPPWREDGDIQPDGWRGLRVTYFTLNFLLRLSSYRAVSTVLLRCKNRSIKLCKEMVVYFEVIRSFFVLNLVKYALDLNGLTVPLSQE
jgi:hypothetical protein